MAGDGGMFAQRTAWGYNRLCAAAYDGAPIERLAEIEVQCVRNMLGNGYAIPTLRQSMHHAYRLLESLRTDLPIESASQRCARLIETVRMIERNSVEAPSSADVAKAVISVGVRIIETNQPLPSRTEFERDCEARLGSFWLHRYGWDLFAPYVMRHGHLSREAYEHMSAHACEQAIADLSEVIHASMLSPGGRLARKRRVARSQPILHTAEGLSQELN